MNMSSCNVSGAQFENNSDKLTELGAMADEEVSDATEPLNSVCEEVSKASRLIWRPKAESQVGKSSGSNRNV